MINIHVQQYHGKVRKKEERKEGWSWEGRGRGMREGMNEFMQPLFDFVIKISDKRGRHFDLPDST